MGALPSRLPNVETTGDGRSRGRSPAPGRRPAPGRSSLAISVSAALVALAVGACSALAHAGPESVPVGPVNEKTALTGAETKGQADSEGKGDVRRGLVAVERDGRVAGVGIVLGSDGRILTSLSAVSGGGSGDDVTVKLPDGRTVKARVGHRDKATDLALLVLQNGKWTEGLRASEVDPAAVSLRAVATASSATAGGARATTVPAKLHGRLEVRPLASAQAPSKDAKDGAPASLSGALDIELPKGASPIPGGPLLDDKGSVMGIMVRACKPQPVVNALAPTTGAHPACTPGFVGAPVAWIRSFLSKTPLEAVSPSPWLGIAGEPGTVGSTSGVRVLAVAPQSPAEKAGLKGNGDRAKAPLIVAVDGTPVGTPEKLSEVIGQHAVGEVVKVMLLDADKLREVAVTLKAAP